MEQKIAIFDEFLKYSRLDKKKYQEEGVKWCLKREICNDPFQNIRGGILADEMGLGKTITMIGLILSNFVNSTLIVLPVALLHQWWKKIEHTTGHKAVIYHGQEKKKWSESRLKEMPIILTTYGTIVMEIKNKEKLSKMVFDRIIFDEAHHLRNKNTKLFLATLHLKSKYKWLVTGTPIQNTISDLYALFAILGLTLEYYGITENQKKIIEALVLKRTRDKVGIVLPSLLESKKNIAWASQDEQNLAEQLHEGLNFSNIKEYKMRKELQGSQTTIPNDYRLAVYNIAKQYCIYPDLVKSRLPILKLKNIIDVEDISLHLENKKIKTLVQDITDKKNNGNKKIIFCSFVGESMEIYKNLEKKNIYSKIIDGKTSMSDRKKIIHELPNILIMQIQTGNEGLNLQEYNEIYFLSPGWNPCIEDQAVARCYRVGQTKPVYVYRYIMNGFDEDSFTQNIENYCETVQTDKRELYKVFE